MTPGQYTAGAFALLFLYLLARVAYKAFRR